ncbi:hypothetical protein RE428_07890 [Marinobacter nanhaiticus D15-8W]|uniref:DUF882 domain-containing protein n=1 Tax=Marinobacter nanhaiticus D15-8W TaxID=626887 RepID=N6W3B1_9GAMM|nr:D-Ala-D-Ala carboxypeptidase family metallohydrolase [Marinobacter nanhaiticus]ENO14589.1 DUF882 domain-containing protein [Marinobacter nanhaiticus D15-8W]BES69726.1 hypothetical protein RE428_07440 [Marinobacter nanhaiticus D15-8W]BES69771.1 hypothetical protein RE428_07890 [Marinobacter nanhaiticus D15-8W]
MAKTDWKNFQDTELQCHCGECGPETWRKIDPDFMDSVQVLRERLGFPLPISSAYRCPNHPDERKKSKPGSHSRGLAIDLQVSGDKALRVLAAVMSMGFAAGVGIAQNGPHASRFIHLDADKPSSGAPRPWLWSY